MKVTGVKPPVLIIVKLKQLCCFLLHSSLLIPNSSFHKYRNCDQAHMQEWN